MPRPLPVTIQDLSHHVFDQIGPLGLEYLALHIQTVLLVQVQCVYPGEQIRAVSWTGLVEVRWATSGEGGGHLCGHSEDRCLQYGSLAMSQAADADDPKVVSFQEILDSSRKRITAVVFWAFGYQDRMLF